MKQFIARDTCGYNSHVRYTHLPSGATHVCSSTCLEGRRAALEWFQSMDAALVIHRCPDGPYRETGNTLGTVGDMVAKLQETP